MHVTEVLAVWPEQHERQRDWLNVPDALARCRHPWMRSAIQQWRASAIAAA
jgi:diphosphoinositol-polyphosphate diphosphatase